MKIASISIADYCEATQGMPHDIDRLYFRMLLKMLSREGGLLDDDIENARMFAYRDVRTYVALKKRLLKWPDTIFAEDGLLKNARVEKDLAEYRLRRAEAAKNGKVGGRSKGRLNGDHHEIDARSDGDQPEIDPRSSGDLGSIPHTTADENNNLAEASPSPSPSPSPEERDLDPFSSVASAAKDDHERVRFSDGKLELFNGLQVFWLEQFDGDAKRLELGLIQAAGFIQPNNPVKPLEAQVGAQLARQCAEKRDRDKRYAKASERNAQAPVGAGAASWRDKRNADFAKVLFGPRGVQ